MFLGTIKESCKESVLDLALFIAESDHDFSEPEEAILTAYQQEMQIEYKPQKRELKTILESLASADMTDKKKILFEMAALVISDKSYSEEEEKLIKEITSAFNIEDGFVPRSIIIIKELNVLYQKATQMVNKDEKNV